VSEAGFTRDALTRVKEHHQLDGVHLGPTNPETWPIRWPDPTITVASANGQPDRVSLESAVAVTTTRSADRRVILYGYSQVAECLIACVFPEKAPPEGEVQLVPWCLARGGQLTPGTFQFRTTSLEGFSRTHTVLPISRTRFETGSTVSANPGGSESSDH
jgi:hypothetical protein